MLREGWFYPTGRPSGAGFTLTEIMIVLVVLGIVLSFMIPGTNRYRDDMLLRGAAESIAGQLRLMRDRAVGTRTSETMKFQAGVSGTDYRVEIGGVIKSGWQLPKKISYAAGTMTSVTITPDGLCSASGVIILRNTQSHRDTVSVLASGLVLTK